MAESFGSIALFPGQGAQAPGMQGPFAEVSPGTFEVASEALGVDMLALCRDGSVGGASLDSTRWAQPAIVACGVAAAHALSSPSFSAGAGHSIGEYTALVVSGALSLPDGLRLVAERAQAMDDACARTPGGMAAVGRIDRDVAERLARANGVALAGDNAPGQLVVSGPDDALTTAIDAVKTAGGVAKRLDVAGAFHSPAMAPAATRLAEALAATEITDGSFPVWSSTFARRLEDPDDARRSLTQQLTHPVRWRETVEDLAGTSPGATFIDLGPGRIVAGLVKRIVPGADIARATDLVETVVG